MSQELHLLVCGSRTITDKNWIFSQIEKYYHENFENFDIILIEGAARGVDLISKSYAIEKGWKVEEYPAEWDKYGKSAGYIRNDVMVKKADAVLILWDGTSKGTKHDIDLCQRYGKQHLVVKYE